MTYANTREHLFDELARIETILDGFGGRSETDSTGRPETVHVDGANPSDTGVSPATEATADTSSSGSAHAHDSVATIDPAVEPDHLTLNLSAEVRDDLTDHADQIERRCDETDADVALRLQTLTDRFDLSRNHLDVFLLALAPDIDERYEVAYQRLQDDTGTRRPTVGFVATLFGATSEQQSAATALVGPDSPLRQHGLLDLSEPAGSSTSHRRRLLTVDQRLVSYLQGHDDLDATLWEVASLVNPTLTPTDLRLESETQTRVDELAGGSNTDRRIYYFHGPEGSEKRRAVEALSGDQLLRADLDALISTGMLDRFRREAVLQDCPVHLTNVSEATRVAGRPQPGEEQTDDDRPTIDDVITALSALECDLFLTASEPWTPATDARDATYILLEFPKPGFELRRQLWETHEEYLADDVDPAVVASTFELTQGSIDGAVATARALSDSDGREPELSRDAVIEGCKAQSAKGLATLAEHIEPSARWEDIVLSDKTERQLHQVAAYIKHRGTVYEQWGFEERFSRGTGVVALFAGPSGTGKTMAAEIIANDTGMALYKIDLSSVVSKYIGETEENLERIFDAARDSNAILLFDEADAVFGQRAGVTDATDRYANVEVNYLLQRIETYDGVVLLTSNFESHIDDAFMRRIHQTVSFRRPKENVREHIWRVMFPEDTPTADLDYEFLAGLDLTGGNIRNVAQTAAVLAADSSADRVGMRHIVEGVRREYDKLDKLLKPDEFGEYRHFLDPERTPPEPSQSAETASTQQSTAGSQSGESGTDSKDVTASGTTPSPSDEDQSDPTETVNGDSPEAVIRELFIHLENGDRDAAHALYHSKAIASEFSPKDIAILSRGDLSIESEFQYVTEARNRVVIQFTQNLNGDRMRLEYELRLEDREWRIYDLGRATRS